MWKTCVAAILVLAPMAVAEVTLQLAEPAGVKVEPGGVGSSFTLDVVLDADGYPVTSVTYAISTDAPGKLRLTGRTITASILKELQTSNQELLATTPIDVATLNPKNVQDVGAVSEPVLSPFTGYETIATLTFTVLEPLPNPFHLSVVGPRAFQLGTWGDPDFNSHDLPITSIALTPEPASAMLVLCGVVGWMRRRRA